MELQWPLILFTTFVAWSAGVFGTQALLALKGEGREVQMPSWITAAVLLVIGGIAVFFHLEHWERIFNGFGHLTSGITQELIAIVLLAVVAVIYIVYLRRSEKGTVPRWVSIVAIAMSVILVAVMAHSYMMAGRPAWDSFFWIFYVLGNACVLGPATVALICAIKKVPASPVMRTLLWGAIINLVFTVVYAIDMQLSGASFLDVGYYYDPTHPTQGMVDVSAITSVFTGELAPIMWGGVILCGAVLPAIAAILEYRKAMKAPSALEAATSTSLAAWMTVAVVGALIGAVCMRVCFYELGLSVFMFY